MKIQFAHAFLVAALLSIPLGFGTGCASTDTHTTASSHVDDQAIATRVKTALNHDLDVNGSRINVTSLNGEVQLSGFANSQMVKDRAGQIAATTPGVVKVYNSIILPTGY
jgi:osmotically-inducible protein OsmY